MIDMSIINEEITRLEHADTNYYNCSHLADLYIVRNNMGGKPHETVEAIKPIEKHDEVSKTAYQSYCDTKRGEHTEDEIIEAMQCVSCEIKDMIQDLYNNLETPEEKAILIQTIADIKTLY